MEIPFRHWVLRHCAVLLLALFGLQATNAVAGLDPGSENMISGTVSLPAGMSAPAGGVGFWVFAESMDGSEWISGDFTIPEGLAAQTYQLYVPGDPGLEWIVELGCYANCDGLPGSLYFHSSGTVYDRYDAEVLAGGSDYSGIDIAFLDAITVSGTISLPLGQVAPAGGAEIQVVGLNENWVHMGFLNVVIPEGDTSISYAIELAEDPLDNWRIWFYCQSGCGGDVYYAVGGAVADYSSATPLPATSDHTNIDVTLPATREISGVLQLPAGQVAPAGGIELSVSTVGSSGGNSDWLEIPEGESSVAYSLQVVDDSSASWRVDYSCFGGCGGYLEDGYYAVGGTTPSYWDADELAGGVDHLNIDLTLLAANQISGTLSLPVGHFAPAGGIPVDIRVIGVSPSGPSGFYDVFTESTYIEDGESSVDYQIQVPEIAASGGWKVAFECDSWDSEYCSANYLTTGFYSTSGTVSFESEATELPAAIDHTGIDMELLEGLEVSGTVSLPAGYDAPAGGLGFEVSASGLSPNHYYSETMLEIPAGYSTANFQLRVPDAPGSEFTVGFLCVSAYDCGDYVRRGYYNTSGVVYQSDQATPLPGGVAHTDISIEIPLGYHIMGSIDKPAGYTLLPSHGTDIEVWVEGNPNGDRFSTLVCHNDCSDLLTSTSGPLSYSVVVPSGTGTNWRVGYRFHGEGYVTPGDSDSLVREGYYAAGGTTYAADGATVLASGQSHTGIDLMLIPGLPVSGTLSLPGEVSGFSAFSIVAENANNGVQIDQYIWLDGSSTDYVTHLPDTPADDWYISYQGPAGQYAPVGYYSLGGTVRGKANATALAGGIGHSGIDLDVLEGGSVVFDFDGDGKSDLFWRNTGNGRNVMWFMDGVDRTGSADTLGLNDPDWNLAGFGDFDGDGRADILWRSQSTGRNVMWFMDGATRTGSSDTTPLNHPDWELSALRDFDGDGKVDLLWRNTQNGRNVIWFMDGATRTGSGDTLGLNHPDWNLAGFGDFNGDGKTDFLWRNTVNGRNVIWLMDGLDRIGHGDTVVLNDPSWTLTGLEDFDGDGKTDFLWRNTGNGRHVMWFMDGATRTGSGDTVGLNHPDWSLTGFGDFNGDARADFLWHNEVNGRNVMWFMDGTTRIGAGDTVTLPFDPWYPHLDKATEAHP